MTLLDLRVPPAAACAPANWTPVVHYDDLQPETRRRRAARRACRWPSSATSDGALYAIDNVDPFTGVAVAVARGIVGTRGEAPTVASPLHKQVFDLRTGRLPRRP